MSYENGIVTKPIGIPDIQEAVGYSSGDIGNLIENGRINVYNIHKPVRSKKKEDITDAEFIGDNICLGFDRLKLIGQNLVELFNIAKENLTWEKIYLRPRGVEYNDTGGYKIEERYRFNDFNGYNKNAIAPYSYNVPKSLVTYMPVKNLKTTRQEFNFQIASGSEIPITAFGVLTSQALGYATTIDQYRYAVAYRKQEGSGWGELKLSYGRSLDTANDPAQTIGVTFSDGTGNYELCFIATRETATSEGDLQQLASAWLDRGFFPLTVSAQRIPIDIDIVNFSNLITAEKTYKDSKYVGVTLRGFTEIHQFTCRAILPEGATTVVSTNGGLEIYAVAMNEDDGEIGKAIINLEYDSFEYSGTGEKSITVDTPSDPLLNTGVFSPELQEYDRINYLVIRVTPWTNMTDDNNGQFRWANGATSQEYRVDFIH